MDTELSAYVFGVVLAILFIVSGFDMLRGRLVTGWLWIGIGLFILPIIWGTSWLR
jgi:hypothetical protein